MDPPGDRVLHLIRPSYAHPTPLHPKHPPRLRVDRRGRSSRVFTHRPSSTTAVAAVDVGKSSHGVHPDQLRELTSPRFHGASWGCVLVPDTSPMRIPPPPSINISRQKGKESRVHASIFLLEPGGSIQSYPILAHRSTSGSITEKSVTSRSSDGCPADSLGPSSME